MGEVVAIGKGQAERKHALIRSALDDLRVAEELDEREDWVDNWVEWYDATLRDVDQIAIVAGAMRVELSRRRGQRVIAEGERRGDHIGNQRTSGKVSQCETFPHDERVRRNKDRLIASHPEEVAQYVQETVAQNKAPSVRGAIRAAQGDGVTSGAKSVTRAPAQETSEDTLLACIEKFADGQSVRLLKTKGAGLTPEGMPQVIHVMRALSLIPWLRVERLENHTCVFHVDQELKSICEARTSRPELDGWSLTAWAKNLRSVIKQKRKENHDERMRSNWSSERVFKRVQTELLDWIEEELDKLP